MIVLAHPMYSRQELNSDSNYVLYASLIRAMRKIRPNWHWVMIFPDSKSGYKYDDDGLFKLPNISRVSMRMSPRKMANVMNFDAIWCDQLFRTIGFDAVFAGQVETVAQLSRSGQAAFVDEGRPATVAAHYYVIHRSLPYTFKSMEHVALAQCMGAIIADHNMFPSDHCKWMFEDMAGDYLRQDLVKEIMGRSSTIPLGTLETSLRYMENDNPEPVIIYNHRLQNYKNYMDTLDLLKEIYAEGYKFKLKVTSTTTENTTRVLELPFAEVHLCSTREDYLRVLRTGDLNTTNSQHETFCISGAESMALGQPLVAPNGITFPQITGRKEIGYPYLFENRAEQKAMLIRLIGDRDERRKWGRKASEFVTKEFDQFTNAERIAALFEELTGRVTMNPKPENLAWIDQNLRANPGAAIRDFWNAVACHEVNGKRPWGSQSLPMTKLVRLIRSLGGRVVIEKGVQRVYPK